MVIMLKDNGYSVPGVGVVRSLFFKNEIKWVEDCISDGLPYVNRGACQISEMYVKSLS